jgi:predicted transcriptional regulator
LEVAFVAGVGGALERAIMDVLWAASGPLRVREVMTGVNEQADRPLAYNTVQTVAERLTKKGLVRRTPDGNAFRYAPTRTRTEYVVELMMDALTDSPDHGVILARFADSVDVDDARWLLAALRRRTGEDPGA